MGVSGVLDSGTFKDVVEFPVDLFKG